ncbi:hypothetical protein FRX31_016506, partial [Thalictrum thalictroides]
EELSLKDWNTIKIDSVEKGEDGSVTKLTGYLTDVLASNSSLKPKLWLPVTDEPVHLSLVKFNNLVTKKAVKVNIQNCLLNSGSVFPENNIDSQ